MLFRQATLEAIAEGRVTVAFRRWRRATVREGGSLRTAIGVLAIDAVERVALADLTDRDARDAGYSDLDTLKADLSKRREGSTYRVAFHLAGADPRIAWRNQTDLTPDEVAALRERLARWDRVSRRGPWTGTYIGLIARSPATRAADLAAEIGVATSVSKPTCENSRNSASPRASRSDTGCHRWGKHT